MRKRIKIKFNPFVICFCLCMNLLIISLVFCLITAKRQALASLANVSSTVSTLGTPNTPYKLGIFTTYKPTICGIAKFSENMVRGFLKTNTKMKIEIFNVIRTASAAKRLPSKIKIIDVICNSETQANAFKSLVDYIKRSKFDGIIINHEYYLLGNFNYYINLLERLKPIKVPIYTILHTPTSYPSSTRRAHLRKVSQLSTKVFVMSWKGKHYLHHSYGIPAKKIIYFPHGIKRVQYKNELLKELKIPNDRFILYCDGIMHTEKGIERVINALVVLKKRKQLDNILLVVAGVNSTGGTYMQYISSLVQKNGLNSYFMWIPKFLTEAEMSTLHKRADIYLTLFDEAIPTSGTLTYGMYAGDAIVSTPYRYSLEVLGIDNVEKKSLCIKRQNSLQKERKIYGNAGISIPFRRPELLADAILDLKNNPELGKKLKKRAKTRVYGYSWENVSAHIAHFLKTHQNILINKDPYMYPLVPSSCSWKDQKITTFFPSSRIKKIPDGYYLMYKDPFVKIFSDISENKITQIEVVPVSNRNCKKIESHSKNVSIITGKDVKLAEKKIKKKSISFIIETPNIVFLVEHKNNISISFTVILENIHACAFGLLGSTLRQKYDLTNPSIPLPTAFLIQKPFKENTYKGK